MRRICFVCKKEVTTATSELNKEVYLPVCNICKGGIAEKKKAEEYLDSLADGLVCGCI
ncbi:MAG: hypothetical protein ACOC1D_04800 [Prolixibacteraceae bacterium]